jgi:hypothetical protein
VALAVSAPVDCEPLTGMLPDQAPEAEQEVALVDVQVKVDAVPLLTVLGVAAKLTVGGCALTVTVVVCDALPPAPVQVSP